MTTPTRPPFLRVVEPEPEPAPIKKQDFGGPTGQHTLFANALPNLIVFIHFEKVNESDFLATILNAKPKFILDLRVAPRFDIGSLNRKLAFSIFAQVGARYFDVAGNLGIRSPRDARLNPEIVVGEIRRSILQGVQQVDGPIVILLGQQQSDADYERHIGIQFESLSPIGWELMRVPASVSAAQETRLRDLVFISHANPEDNDFALWLGAKLTLLGYRVWSDLTRLIGGEEFWDDIEEAIREHSAKVVVCLSRIAQKKKGVLDEIACAVGTERSMGLENFVVPIRIDSLPFSEVRANVGRKNIIDFHGNWAKGLSALVGAFERDAVPQPIENGQSAVSLLSRLNANAQSRLIEAEDQLQANWLLISSLPDFVHFSEFSSSNQNMHRIQASLSYPTFEHLRLLGSFVPAEKLQLHAPTSVNISRRAVVPLLELIQGQHGDLPYMASSAARNHVKSLLKKHWDEFAKARGLRAFETASKQYAWYPSRGLIPDDTVRFLDVRGSKKRRALIGWSEKRRVHWHFAIEATPVLAEPMHFTFKPHVIFTEDGKSPISSDARMHSLRRGFCKSWWNDRWRDLTAAFAAWLANGEQEIVITIAGNLDLRLRSDLMTLTAPMALRAEGLAATESSSEQADADWLDDPELDDTELEALNGPTELLNPSEEIEDYDS